uniref:Disintegrin domain-containing protein n=1 Tax=Parastrongyloides trichosuri TaxID=131310 RepID=A0A0N4ZCC5_PARTI
MEVGVYKDYDLDIKDYQIDIIMEKTNILLQKAVLKDKNSNSALIIQLSYEEIKTLNVLSEFQVISQISNNFKSGNILFTNKNFGKDYKEVLGFSFGLFCNNQGYNTIGILTNVTETSFSYEDVMARRILHEIGHSLNANHDIDNGFIYNIMSPVEILDSNENNTLYSDISISQISKYVFGSCKRYLVDFNINNCGNGILDDGEECDEGHKNFIIEFKCCNEYCKLKKNATCSHYNHDCCLKCQIAPKNVSCQPEIPYKCLGESFCDGKSLTCPEPKQLPDNTKCLKNGARCLNGKCVDKCKHINENLIHCLCKDEEFRCHQCCKNLSDNVCKPLGNNIQMEEGSICSSNSKKFRCNNNSQCVYDINSKHFLFYEVNKKGWYNYYFQNTVTILFMIALPCFVFWKVRKVCF